MPRVRHREPLLSASETISIGDVTITRVVEWSGSVAPVDIVLPDATLADWNSERALLASDHWHPADNGYVSRLQTWVVRSAGRVILIDTGAGNGRERPNLPAFHRLHTDYLGSLSAAGVEVNDVDVVISTHLHGDHVGWNTVADLDGYRPTFPNARYLINRAELDFWDPATPGASISADMMLNVFDDSIAPVRDAGLIDLWDDELQLDESLRLVRAPGHTPGMAILQLESAGENAVFAADAFHSPLQVSHAHVNSCFCEDPTRARSARGQLLRWAADRHALVLPSHLGGHAAFEVGEANGKFHVQGWAPFPTAPSQNYFSQ